MQMYLPPYRLRVIVLLLVLVAIFATVFEGVNTSLMKVSSHCIALTGNFMPGEVGNGSGMLGHPLFAAHYNIHAGERSSHVSDIQLKMCVIAVWSHTLHTPQNMWHFIVTLKKALMPKKKKLLLFGKQATAFVCRTHGSMLPICRGLWGELFVTSLCAYINKYCHV